MSPTRPFELGVYTFGNTPRTADDGTGATAQALRDAREAVQPADDVGLDFFGFGEHHTRTLVLPIPRPVTQVPPVHAVVPVGRAFQREHPSLSHLTESRFRHRLTRHLKRFIDAFVFITQIRNRELEHRRC